MFHVTLYIQMDLWVISKFVYNWTLKPLRKCLHRISRQKRVSNYTSWRTNISNDEQTKIKMSEAQLWCPLKQRTEETNVPIIPPLLDRNKTQTKIRLAFMKNAVVSVFFGRNKRLREEGKTLVRRGKKRRRFLLFAVIFSARHYPGVLSRVRPNEQNAFDGHDWPV